MAIVICFNQNGFLIVSEYTRSSCVAVAFAHQALIQRLQESLMRTTSFALLFSAAVAAPAFASGNGTEASYRPVSAAPQHSGTAAPADATSDIVSTQRDRPINEDTARN
jgi:hypothetical protein